SFIMIRKTGLFALLALLLSGNTAEAQLKKLKERLNQAVDKAIGNEVEKKTGLPTGDNGGGSSSNGGGGSPVNKTGAGLTNTEPPDVKAQMAEAKTAHGSAKYSDARYALGQALMGVEIQLGREILKSLPESVSGLNADKSLDRVMSNQWGFSNMTIQRVYKNGADKQMTIGIGNTGIYGGLAQIYFANVGMIEASNNQQNYKQVRIKGNKGVIQYDDSKGYSLAISIGQTSGIFWECINFETEQEVMKAAESFDIDGIKKMLGEQ
nr:hypothetical protein [Chitinophagaceae bacterium]